MIVDDNAKIRSVIRDTVAEEGDEVFEYENGLQAVAAYGSVRPDWVMMDLLMNEMDGLSATKRIRESFPDAQILIVTNYDGIPFRTEAYSYGVKAYVLKEDIAMLPSLMKGVPDIHHENKTTKTASYSENHQCNESPSNISMLKFF
ncbi:MAG: response regulator transcription factor [Ignavibacteriae bacterium]|nr:response regulator transcription factor [Ignavibacteriota bacterium]